MTASRRHAATSRLMQASVALMVTTALNAALGFAFWLVAARLYDSAAVGLAAGGISALTLVANAGWTGLQHVVLRYVPIGGARRGPLLLWCYAAALAAALLAAIAFVALGRELFGVEAFLDSPLRSAAFVAAVGIWVVFSLQDPALVALGRPQWVPVENAVFGAVKLGAIVALAGVGTAWAIFGAWVTTAAVIVVAVSRLLQQRVLVTPGGPDELPPAGRIARFAAGHQGVALAVTLPDPLVPLLVLAILTPADAAHYYAAFTIAFSLRLLAANLASALTVEGARSQADLRRLTRRVSQLATLLLGPLALLVVVAADPIMHAFGADYAGAGTALLRWFGAALPFAAVVVIGLALERVHQRVGFALLIGAASTIVTIAVDLLLLSGRGIAGAGIGFLAGQATGAAIVGGSHLIRRRRPADPKASRHAADGAGNLDLLHGEQAL